MSATKCYILCQINTRACHSTNFEYEKNQRISKQCIANKVIKNCVSISASTLNYKIRVHRYILEQIEIMYLQIYSKRDHA